MQNRGSTPRIEKRRPSHGFLSWSLAILILAAGICSGAEPPAPIPEDEIAAMRAELAQAAKEASSVKARMACKGVIRKGNALRQASPDAPNRFALIDVMFKGYGRLMSLEPTQENREALFDIAAQLA